jgi:cytochrome P450
LATNPRVFEKLRAVIAKDFPVSPDDGGTVEFAGLKSCKYLQWVILETLRLYPVVPTNIRTAVRDTILPVGGGPDGSKPVPVRKGQTVSMIIYAMHRRPDIWGEDVKEFRPERFENRKMDWSFLP